MPTFSRFIVLTVCALALTRPVRAEDWPTARHDAQRTNATSQKLADQLHPQWVRELPRLARAWPDQVKLTFDRAYEPVVAGSLLFAGSSRSDTLLALDTHTGAERWSYHFAGPVRLAPAIWNGLVYVACDDGFLYCLSADEGKLFWKFRGGPGDQKVLGNGRLVSAWPARGGPVIADGVVYFGASIWPFMGVFIHALDARTGKVIWTSDGDGSLYHKQPHNAESFAGVAPQGHLVIAGDKLLVPGGRSVPACYDRRTGKLLYFRLAENGKRGGGAEVAVLGDAWFNGGAAFDRNTGEFLAPFPARVVLGTEVVGYAAGKFTSFTAKSSAVEEVESIDRKGVKTVKMKWKTGEQRSTPKAPAVETMIEAGSRLYAGSPARLSAYELPLPKDKPAEAAWEAAIEGTPAHLVAADDRLFAVTLEGRIYCFGAEKVEAKVHRQTPEPLPDGGEWAGKAKQILDATGGREGHCLALGVGSGKLVAELLRQSKLSIIVLDPDAERVQAFRREMIAADVHGERVAALVGDPLTLTLPPYLATLIVSEDPEHVVPSEAFTRKLFAALRPYGGVACFDLPAAKRKSFMRVVEKLDLPGAQAKEIDGQVLFTRVGALPGAANWTHEHADAGNTRASRDSVVKAPLGVLWFGGVTHDGVLPRHGHGPQPQVIDGRAIVEGVDMMRALDIYTGRLLWETKLPGIGKVFNTLPHQPGANASGGNYVSVSDGIYVLHGNACVRLDPATGERRDTFHLPTTNGKPAPEWTYLNVFDDFLIGGAMPPRAVPRQPVTFHERLEVWNIEDEEVTASLEGHTDDVLAIVYSPDGKVRATAGEDRIIRLWDVEADKLLGALEKHEEGVTCLAFSPDGKTLASGGREKLIHLWDLKEQKVRETLKGHRDTVVALVFARDGKTLASADGDANVRLWDAETGKPAGSIEGNLEDTTAVTLSADAKLLVAGNSDGMLKFIDVATREARAVEGTKSAVQVLAVSPDGKTLAVGHKDKNVRLWDIPTGKATNTLSPHSGPISTLVFARDNGTLFVGTEEASVYRWDLKTRKIEGGFKTGAGAVLALAFTPDEKSLLTASSEKLLKLGPGFRSSTRILYVMDRHTGKVVWKREARDTFRNNALCMGGGRLYCIDRLSPEEVARLRRRGAEPKNPARLFALDLKTGDEVWSAEASIFGTWLGYSAKHDVLVEAGRKTRDSLTDEPKGVHVFNAATGKTLWKDTKQGGPPLLRGDLLIHETGACDLRTGKPKMRSDPVSGAEIEWKWARTYGCNTPAAAENLMTFRSGAAGYCDLSRDGGTGNFGGFRSSCTNNLVVAGGLIVAPDYTRNCTCSYQNQTSLALVPMPDVEAWTSYPMSGTSKAAFSGFLALAKVEGWDKDPPTVKHLAVNIGAPGHRRADDGRLWLNEYSHARLTLLQSRAGEGEEPKPIEGLGLYNQHSSRIAAAKGTQAWIVASGVRGVSQLEIAVKADKKQEEGTPYTLRLHFADPDNAKEGTRVFDILHGDTMLAEKVDIAKEAGGRYRGLVREFKNVRVHGKLVLRFVPAEKDITAATAPILCGFEMLREE